MKRASGYVTSDGEFFEDKRHAELHEAERDLMSAAATFGIETKNLFALCGMYGPEMRRYIDARKAFNDRVKSEPSPSVGDTGDDTEAERIASAVFQQPPGGGGAVSDVGSSKRSKAVRDKRKVDGP